MRFRSIDFFSCLDCNICQLFHFRGYSTFIMSRLLGRLNDMRLFYHLCHFPVIYVILVSLFSLFFYHLDGLFPENYSEKSKTKYLFWCLMLSQSKESSVWNTTCKLIPKLWNYFLFQLRCGKSRRRNKKQEFLRSLLRRNTCIIITGVNCATVALHCVAFIGLYLHMLQTKVRYAVISRVLFKRIFRSANTIQAESKQTSPWHH